MTPMMAITTNNSTSVNPPLIRFERIDDPTWQYEGLSGPQLRYRLDGLLERPPKGGFRPVFKLLRGQALSMSETVAIRLFAHAMRAISQTLTPP